MAFAVTSLGAVPHRNRGSVDGLERERHRGTRCQSSALRPGSRESCLAELCAEICDRLAVDVSLRDFERVANPFPLGCRSPENACCHFWCACARDGKPEPMDSRGGVKTVIPLPGGFEYLRVAFGDTRDRVSSLELCERQVQQWNRSVRPRSAAKSEALTVKRN